MQLDVPILTCILELTENLRLLFYNSEKMEEATIHANCYRETGTVREIVKDRTEKLYSVWFRTPVFLNQATVTVAVLFRVTGIYTNYI